MLLLPQLGQVLLSPPELQAVADALEIYSERFGSSEQDEREFLLISALQCAFAALAIATAFDLHIEPDAEKQARQYCQLLKPKAEEKP